MSRELRRWQVHRRIGSNLADLAAWINPIVRGWVQYYGAFYATALHPLLRRINTYLIRFLQKRPLPRRRTVAYESESEVPLKHGGWSFATAVRERSLARSLVDTGNRP